jgi:hypothetical protein
VRKDLRAFSSFSLLIVLLGTWLVSNTSFIAMAAGSSEGGYAKIEAVSFDKSSYEPGERGTCTVKFVSFFDVKIKVVKVEFRTDFGAFTWTGELIIEPRASGAVSVSFTIPKDTKEGEYMFTIQSDFMVWQGKVWSAHGSAEYGPTGPIKVAKSMIPGFPWESVVLGLSAGIVALLFSRRQLKIPFTEGTVDRLGIGRL